MMTADCPDFRTTCRFSRRRLLQAGTAGIAGLNLPALLQGRARRLRPAGAGQAHHLPAPVRRPVAPRHVRHEARRARRASGASSSRSPPASPGLTVSRASAAVRHGDRPVRPGAVGPSPDEEPQLGDLLQPDRPRPAARRHPAPRHPGALSGLRQHGRQAPAGRRSGDPHRSSPSRTSSATAASRPGQHASFLGKAFDPFFIGQDPNRSDFRLPELSLPSSLSLDRLDDRRGLQQLIDQQTDLLVLVGDGPGDRRLLHPGPDDAQLAQGQAGLRPLARARDGSATTTAGRPTARAACWPAGWSRPACGSSRSISRQSIGGKGNGGWDTHGDNFNQLKNRLLPITDQTVPTLIQDLAGARAARRDAGRLDGRVRPVAQGRRTPSSSAPTAATTGPSATRSSSPAAASTPGAIYGSSDRIGAYPATDPVTPDDIAATMFWALGIDPATEVTDTLGRPLPIAAGKPITPSSAESGHDCSGNPGWVTRRCRKRFPWAPLQAESAFLARLCMRVVRERDRTGGREKRRDAARNRGSAATLFSNHERAEPTTHD